MKQRLEAGALNCPTEDLLEQIETAQDGSLLLDAAFKVLYINRKAEEFLRRPRAELLGKVIWDEFRVPAAADLERHLRRVMRERTTARVESYEPQLQAWYEFQMNPTPQGLAVWFRDITDRKRLQSQAENSAAMLAALMEHVPESLTVVNASTGLVEMVSRYSAEVSKRRPEDLIGTAATEYGRIWHILRPDGSTPEFDELPGARAVRGEVVACEEWILERGDGVRINVLYDAAPIRDRAGAVTGAVLVWRDITERKAQEELRAESRRLTMATTLAGGIAHQFNNLLTGIIGNIELVSSRFDASDPDYWMLDTSRQSAAKAAELVRKLLGCVGRSVFTFVEPLDLSRFIRGLEREIRAIVPEHILLHLDLEDRVCCVRADPEQMREALILLLSNALEAVGDQPGGSIWVNTGFHTLNPKILQGLHNGAKLPPGEYASLGVGDTGSGIDPKHKDRIFEPFFSTKFLGRGLGLAAVDGIVRGHHGAVEVLSEPRRGSIFRLYFPAERASDASHQV